MHKPMLCFNFKMWLQCNVLSVSNFDCNLLKSYDPEVKNCVTITMILHTSHSFYCKLIVGCDFDLATETLKWWLTNNAMTSTFAQKRITVITPSINVLTSATPTTIPAAVIVLSLDCSISRRMTALIFRLLTIATAHPSVRKPSIC